MDLKRSIKSIGKRLIKQFNHIDIIKKIWFYIIIGLILIVFIFVSYLIAIWLFVIFLGVVIVIYLPSFSFKSRLIRFMNNYYRIDDEKIAITVLRPIDEIREKMEQLAKKQTNKKWLIVFLSDRYIFYKEDTIIRFKEFYYNGYIEKEVFEKLNSEANVNTRAEVRAIENTLINQERLFKRKI